MFRPLASPFRNIIFITCSILLAVAHTTLRCNRNEARQASHRDLTLTLTQDIKKLDAEWTRACTDYETTKHTPQTSKSSLTRQEHEEILQNKKEALALLKSTLLSNLGEAIASFFIEYKPSTSESDTIACQTQLHEHITKVESQENLDARALYAETTWSSIAEQLNIPQLPKEPLKNFVYNIITLDPNLDN